MGNHLTPLKIFIAVFITAAIFSCSHTPREESSPAIVKTAKVKQHTATLTKSYPAVIQSSSDVKLAFRVAGPIKNIYVNEGTFVKKNQVLAQIDPRDYKLQLQATEAKYQEVKAEVERITALHEKGKVSDNEYDKAVSGLKQITAKYNSHKNALSDTKLRAPFSGHVNKIFFEADETVDAGMPIVSLIDTQQYEIVTHLPASDYLNRSRFTKFYCRTVDEPENSLPLELRNIVSKANLNGLYPAYFNLTNTQKGKVLPGMSAEVIIDYEGENSHHYEIPATAIFNDSGQSKVWVITPKDKTVHSHQIKIIELKSSGSAIVTGSISDKDAIISAGVHSLREGQQVKVLNQPSESNVGGLL